MSEELKREIQSPKIPLACLFRFTALKLAKSSPNPAINAH